MFADDLVVIGGGKLLASESVNDITARNDVQVVVETRQQDDLVALLSDGVNNIGVETAGHQLLIRGVTRASVSQVAFDNQIRLTELTETSMSLEDTLLEMTSASAEFAAT